MDILFPAGRMIGGDVNKLFPRTDDNGKPKVGKDGVTIEMVCNIGYAIPKGPEKAWWETPWGAEIYKVGAAAHPNLVASPAFSWKITDGDSPIPNKAGKKPCDRTGYPGHWVLWFSQGWLPKRVNVDGTVELADGAIVAGFYVQMYGSVNGNTLKPNGTPGVYLNPIAVALVGEGDRISTDVDTTAVGFGGAGLPAGARPVSPVVPGMPAMGAPAVPAPVAAPPAVPAPIAAAPAPAGPVMTAAAQYTYEQYRASNWTDEQLIGQGLMQAPVAAPAPAPVAAPPAAAPPAGVVAPTAPNMSFAAPPAAPGYAAPPAAPPAAPAPAAKGYTMTAKAAGATREAFHANGWTDQQLWDQGYMQ